MKVAAHPMLVAVALGLLGPGALAADVQDDRSERPGSTRAVAEDASSVRQRVEDALEDADAPSWARLTLVDVADDVDEADVWTNPGV